MDIRNGKEILKEFLGKYNFSSVYFENGYSWGTEEGTFFGDTDSAAEFLIASAVTGNKVIGFFRNLPCFKDVSFLRGECVFVVENIPQDITYPIIFARTPEEIAKRLAITLKISQECKLPAILIFSHNCINAYGVFEKFNIDLVRTSPYIHFSSVSPNITEEGLQEKLEIAAILLQEEFPLKDKTYEKISFQNSMFDFFDYFVPRYPSNQLKKFFSNNEVYIDESEALDFVRFIKKNYGIDLSYKIIESSEEIKVQTKDLLCPGCPFVSIFIKSDFSSKIVFTNISCEGLTKVYPLIFASFDSYCGFLSNGLNVDTIFIGTISSYKPYYNKFIKNGRVIFLNDCGLSSVNICSSISHPKKIPMDKRNVLFPYSCSNIKKYSKPKIKEKRCQCIKKDEVCSCMEKTKCPALYIKEGKVVIDNQLCSGCFACKNVCKFGAVS